MMGFVIDAVELSGIVRVNDLVVDLNGVVQMAIGATEPNPGSGVDEAMVVAEPIGRMRGGAHKSLEDDFHPAATPDTEGFF
jgi:hypothetical protein